MDRARFRSRFRPPHIAPTKLLPRHARTDDVSSAGPYRCGTARYCDTRHNLRPRCGDLARYIIHRWQTRPSMSEPPCGGRRRTEGHIHDLEERNLVCGIVHCARLHRELAGHVEANKMSMTELIQRLDMNPGEHRRGTPRNRVRSVLH